MRFDVLSLFPQLVEECCSHGVVGRAFQRGDLSLGLVNPRDFTEDVHRTVDDRPYGGGSGMLLKPEPLQRALESVSGYADAHVVCLSAQGRPLDQQCARALAQMEHLVLVCGRYEGIDQRFIDSCVDEEISIGDYVLSGGELAAAVLIDAVARMIPGVVAQVQSLVEDSFFEGLLDAPHYTRPVEFAGRRVPDVLLSGHHEQIAEWRAQQSLRLTWERRPDLLANAELTSEQRAQIARWEKEREHV